MIRVSVSLVFFSARVLRVGQSFLSSFTFASEEKLPGISIIQRGRESPLRRVLKSFFKDTHKCAEIEGESSAAIRCRPSSYSSACGPPARLSFFSLSPILSITVLFPFFSQRKEKPNKTSSSLCLLFSPSLVRLQHSFSCGSISLPPPKSQKRQKKCETRIFSRATKKEKKKLKTFSPLKSSLTL